MVERIYTSSRFSIRLFAEICAYYIASVSRMSLSDAKLNQGDDVLSQSDTNLGGKKRRHRKTHKKTDPKKTDCCWQNLR